MQERLIQITRSRQDGEGEEIEFEMAKDFAISFGIVVTAFNATDGEYFAEIPDAIIAKIGETQDLEIRVTGFEDDDGEYTLVLIVQSIA